MTKIELARKFLTLKTEVSGATFNEDTVCFYAKRNSKELLLELIEKAEAALESIKKNQKVMDYFETEEGMEAMNTVENIKKNTYEELKRLNDNYSKAIVETIKVSIDSKMVEATANTNNFIIGISDGNGGVKSMKRFDIYFSDYDWADKPTIELSGWSTRISLVPEETDEEEVELVNIMNEFLHNKALIERITIARNEWRAKEREFWNRIDSCDKWLKNPFENEMPEDN